MFQPRSMPAAHGLSLNALDDLVGMARRVLNRTQDPETVGSFDTSLMLLEEAAPSGLEVLFGSRPDDEALVEAKEQLQSTYAALEPQSLTVSEIEDPAEAEAHESARQVQGIVALLLAQVALSTNDLTEAQRWLDTAVRVGDAPTREHAARVAAKLAARPAAE
ncbi:MAG: hypothetical protein AAF624_14785 [Bacteroidota bacterium]